MSTKMAVNQDVNKLREEADSLIAGFHAEIGAAGPQTYFRMKGFLDRLNRLGGINLSSFENEIVNKAVIKINEAANERGLSYRLVKKEGMYELITEKVSRKTILLASGRDKKPVAKDEDDKEFTLAEKLKLIAKKGPQEKQVDPDDEDDDLSGGGAEDDPEAEQNSIIKPDLGLPRASRD